MLSEYCYNFCLTADMYKRNDVSPSMNVVRASKMERNTKT
jgi:hypothetical protein